MCGYDVVGTSDGNYAYLARGYWKDNRGVLVFNVQNKNFPDSIYVFNEGTFAEEMALSSDENYLFLTEFTFSLAQGGVSKQSISIWDMSTPSMPVFHSKIETGHEYYRVALMWQKRYLFTRDENGNVIQIQLANLEEGKFEDMGILFGYNIDALVTDRDYLYAGTKVG